MFGVGFRLCFVLLCLSNTQTLVGWQFYVVVMVCCWCWGLLLLLLEMFFPIICGLNCVNFVLFPKLQLFHFLSFRNNLILSFSICVCEFNCYYFNVIVIVIVICYCWALTATTNITCHYYYNLIFIICLNICYYNTISFIYCKWIANKSFPASFLLVFDSILWISTNM